MSSLRLSFLAALVALSLTACDKDSTGPAGASGKPGAAIDSSQLPQVITQSPRKVTRIQATCGGLLFLEGGSRVREQGVCWSTHPLPTIADDHAPDQNRSANFEIAVGNLRPGTTYHVRAYATNDQGTGYGDVLEFTTADPLAEPTCAPDTNTATIDGWGLTYRSLFTQPEDIGRYKFKIRASGSTSDLTLHFTRPPRTGLYETRSASNSMDLDSTQVVVDAVAQSQYRSAQDGGTVKVVRRNDSSYVVTFCDLKLGYFTADQSTSQGLLVVNP